VADRGRRGDHAVYYDHGGMPCRTPGITAGAAGRWRAERVRTSANYTVAHAINDWLETLADRDAKTITTLRELLDPLKKSLGQRVLRDLTADDVLAALQESAETRSTRAVRDSRANPVRVITHAQARGKVSRNAAPDPRPLARY
jgi:hypothetical protein